MSQPVFLLQIVYPEGAVVRFPGGGPLERDLIESCVAKLPYVGLMRTQAGVERAVREAITQAILDLKKETLRIATG